MHQKFQVPKSGAPYKTVLGVGVPLHAPLHTAYICECLHLRYVNFLMNTGEKNHGPHEPPANLVLTWLFFPSAISMIQSATDV